jgi:hypothetical protein
MNRLLPSEVPAFSEFRAKKTRQMAGFFLEVMAERTGLEPATSGVTGQHSNRLNYRSTLTFQLSNISNFFVLNTLWRTRKWRPHGDSNPGRHRERVMS